MIRKTLQTFAVVGFIMSPYIAGKIIPEVAPKFLSTDANLGVASRTFERNLPKTPILDIGEFPILEQLISGLEGIAKSVDNTLAGTPNAPVLPSSATATPYQLSSLIENGALGRDNGTNVLKIPYKEVIVPEQINPQN